MRSPSCSTAGRKAVLSERVAGVGLLPRNSLARLANMAGSWFGWRRFFSPPGSAEPYFTVAHFFTDGPRERRRPGKEPSSPGITPGNVPSWSALWNAGCLGRLGVDLVLGKE